MLVGFGMGTGPGVGGRGVDDVGLRLVGVGIFNFDEVEFEMADET